MTKLSTFSAATTFVNALLSTGTVSVQVGNTTFDVRFQSGTIPGLDTNAAAWNVIISLLNLGTSAEAQPLLTNSNRTVMVNISADTLGSGSGATTMAGQEIVNINVTDINNLYVATNGTIENFTIQHIVNHEIMHVLTGLDDTPAFIAWVNLVNTQTQAGPPRLSYQDVILGRCFLAGTPIDMADGTQKPIERIRTGDMVMSFNGAANKGRGALVPQRVISTKQNITDTIINLRGLMVTAGHVTLKGEGGFAELRHILRDDGTLVERDGRLVRARSGLPVDSAGDIAVHVEYADPVSGQTRVITARAGIPCGVMNDGKTWKSLGLAIAESGGRVRADGLIEYPDGIRMHAIWPTGWTQTPFDHPLARNFIIRDHDGKDYVPEWCGEADDAQEGMREVVSGPGKGRMFAAAHMSGASVVDAAKQNWAARRKIAALRKVK